ncbi:MAG: ATP-dependent helicase [Candidatus Aenigmatarchaeota archaeon]|nr:MAG: ATP-dependent helicase [Candidatus Aenigmarchaeota archaeon]
MRFDQLNLKDKLLESIKRLGFEELTPIQERCIPAILEGRDVVGQAETGSGKTVAFALPVVQKIAPGKGPQVLALAPTRELCIQITDVFKDLGSGLGLKVISVYGGVGIEGQIRDIPSADIIVGTPGRILDHLGRKTISFSNVRHLILDETDRMLDMGFIDDVERIINSVPKDRQTLMFSATISYDIKDIMNRYLKDPEMITTRTHVDTSKLKQVYYDIYPHNEKFSLLVHLLKHTTPGLAIVFCATRHEAEIVVKNLRKQGIDASAIHGGMSQHLRTRSLQALKENKVDVLVATDVAARGLDIKNITHIYNYDVPKTAKEYIHRIGRTARAGKSGDAVTLLVKRDHDNFRRVLSDPKIDVDKENMPHFKKIPFDRCVGRDRKSHRGGYKGRRGGSGPNDRRRSGGPRGRRSSHSRSRR